MSSSITHEMHMHQTFSDGSQEWMCPTCGRHFIIHFPPNFHMDVIAEGDLNVVHTGGSGGVQMHAAEMEQSQTPSYEDVQSLQQEIRDDPYLEPYERWLDREDRFKL